MNDTKKPDIYTVAHLVVHKETLTPKCVVYGNINATENDSVKLYPVAYKHLDEVYRLLKCPSTHCELMSRVLTANMTTQRRTRDTNSQKYLSDKDNAIKAVLEGGKVATIATHYNLNPRTLSNWVSKARKEL